jgi:hypothetical protein
VPSDPRLLGDCEHIPIRWRMAVFSAHDTSREALILNHEPIGINGQPECSVGGVAVLPRIEPAHRCEPSVGLIYSGDTQVWDTHPGNRRGDGITLTKPGQPTNREGVGEWCGGDVHIEAAVQVRPMGTTHMPASLTIDTQRDRRLPTGLKGLHVNVVGEQWLSTRTRNQQASPTSGPARTSHPWNSNPSPIVAMRATLCPLRRSTRCHATVRTRATRES